jgi:hypothetical protein
MNRLSEERIVHPDTPCTYPLADRTAIGSVYGRPARRARVEARAAATDSQLARARRCGALGLPWTEASGAGSSITHVAYVLAAHAQLERDDPVGVIQRMLAILHDRKTHVCKSAAQIWRELIWNELYELAHCIYEGRDAGYQPDPIYHAMGVWDPEFLTPFRDPNRDMDPAQALCCCYTIYLAGGLCMPPYALNTPETFRILLGLGDWRDSMVGSTIPAPVEPYLHAIRDSGRWAFMLGNRCFEPHWVDAARLFGSEYMTNAILALVTGCDDPRAVQSTEIHRALDAVGRVQREQSGPHLERLELAARSRDVDALVRIALDMLLVQPGQCRKALDIIESHNMTDAVDELPVYQHLFDTATSVKQE